MFILKSLIAQIHQHSHVRWLTGSGLPVQPHPMVAPRRTDRSQDEASSLHVQQRQFPNTFGLINVLIVNRNIGFTLIELMVTITIAAIVLVIGVPSFQETIRNNRLATQANQLISALTLARSEAIKRGVPVSICKSANGATCGGSGWSNGWIIFANPNNNATVDSGEEILRIYGPVPPHYSLNANRNFVNSITYHPTGRSNNIGRFVLCENGQLSYSKVIFINISGRPRLGQDNNHNNIPEDNLGNDIGSCTPS